TAGPLRALGGNESGVYLTPNGIIIHIGPGDPSPEHRVARQVIIPRGLAGPGQAIRPALAPMALTAPDLMNSVLPGGEGVGFPAGGGPPCDPSSLCFTASKQLDDPEKWTVFPADLGTVRSMLQQAALPLRTQSGAAGLAAPAGSGLAFTARDLMIPVMPF